jgi:8-oxo-dGTP pyrophosphatase MutT (NUDIX family)
MKKKKLWVPDILYHATTERNLSFYQREGSITHKHGKRLFLSRSEGHAWQVAHRLHDHPMVLIVNTSQARRERVFFEKNHHGLWHVPFLPLSSVVNIQNDYLMQVSSGGIPLYEDEDGPQLALIRVKHHHATTWEVSKGRLEIGETPLMTAQREIQEEMGVSFSFGQALSLGSVRFAFYTKNKEARLKEMHLYLLRVNNKPNDFKPATDEGLVDVQWFSPSEAIQLVNHRTLKPIFRQMRYHLKALHLLEDS